MKIIFGDHYPLHIEDEAKILAKKAGYKIKDIAVVVIKPTNYGMCLQVWGKKHEFIANEAI